ncbi:MAG TPA: SMC-Scp complex subunit ScpB [Polyangiaceae bacterium]|nr:SMC-Scp complex subunit ScpB [Polyangiaceae bacterium]
MSHDPKNDERGPDTVPPAAEPTGTWDDQPTVDMTGDDLADLAAPPTPRDDEAPDEAEIEQARALSRAHLTGLVEALIFASDKPIKDREVARLASAPVKQVREVLGELRAVYAERGIVLSEIAGGWLFRTAAQFAPFVRELSAERPVRLTRAQVETLAIVAYRQPVTRPEIDDIRGVDSGATLKLLLERDLVRILGKKDEPGRPLLYGTTTQFLEFFGLKSLKDLPTLKEFTELSDESRRIAETELGEVLPESVADTVETKSTTDTISAPPLDEENPERDTVTPPPGDVKDEPN